VTAGGKKVAPAVLEDLIRRHPLVGQCLVVGDGRPYVAALITLDPHTAAAWAERNGRKPDPEELYDDPDVLAQLQEVVDEANASVSQAESVRRFEVLPAAWTEEAGYLTPTLRLKRAQVIADFRSEIEALYD
jgi:long-chain acyl-CoA synthetase